MNRRFVLLAVVAIAAGAIWWTQKPTSIVIPAVEWRVGAGTEYRQARNYDDVEPETGIRLWVRCDEPRHVYVFSHSTEDGTLLLFPSPAVKADVTQPLAAGSATLPGRRDDKELAWHSRRQILATTTFLVVAAREPIAELDALLPKLRRWTNTAMTDGSMQVTYPPEGAERAGEPRKPLPDALLQRAADVSLTATVVNGPLQADAQRPGVWIGSWRIKEKAAAPKPNGGDEPKRGG
jgi:hypothetical protein